VPELVDWLRVLTTILADGSFALAVGVLLAGAWGANGLRRFSTVALAFLAGCYLVRPWFLAESMSGSTGLRETLGLVPDVLSSTRQGALWYAGGVVIVILLVAHVAWPSRPAIQLVALSALAATKAASTHASEAGDWSVAELAEFLHLAATAVWAGAILVSAWFVVPLLTRCEGPDALWKYGRRLSRTVTYALLALAASGLYVSWSDMHSEIGRLWTTGWGKILLVKLFLVGIAALLGSMVRFRCLRRPANSDRARLMEQLLCAEATALALVLCLSGALANANPGL